MLLLVTVIIRVGMAFFAVLCLIAHVSAQTPPARIELAQLAGAVCAALEDEGQKAVVLGAITAPTTKDAARAEMCRRVLHEELTRRKVSILAEAPLQLRGELRQWKEGSLQLWLWLQDRQGHLLGSIANDLEGEDWTILNLGVGNAIPGESLLKTASKPISEAAKKSLRDDPASPYSVQLLKRKGDRYAARQIELDKGVAFADLEAGDVYAVGLANDSDLEAAVTISIDGVNLFSYSELRGPQGQTQHLAVLVPAHSRVLVRGWRTTGQRVTEFQVGEHVRASLGHFASSNSPVGSVAVSFVPTWTTSARIFGVARSAVTLRYLR